MEVGFVGLGLLGQAMVKRLSSQGVKVTVWNRSLEKAKVSGLPYVETLEELIDKEETIFLCVKDSQAVEDLLTQMSPYLKDKIIIDTSTNCLSKVLEFHRFLKEKGGFYLECPVLGSVIPAEKGQLTLLISGEEKVFEKVKPLLQILSQRCFYLQTPGKATKAKLINNYLLALIMEALASAIVLGENIGFNKEELLNILENGAGNSYVLKVKKEALLKENFIPHFSLENLIKDLNYAEELFKTFSGIALEGALVKELYRIGINLGLKDKDFSAIYYVLKSLQTQTSG
ncbi:NAD(P)-dependent oxidoreductase [Thermodesulfobacterium sp. TA1]|uniref:NAD(P)-dependent oxidoreductase n=1 Tax=Thermodesulfobacterium sp. TA1 TaxID=2234087 RepID=UPI001231A476|nr:NAD(P)-dependent oxidoreductase [Thermodesulfobacterium sp. TA1]QER41677.1 NAD(P)-dependent oxidoreductase [Thermodesulfobacterium sp. TA1]